MKRHSMRPMNAVQTSVPGGRQLTQDDGEMSGASNYDTNSKQDQTNQEKPPRSGKTSNENIIAADKLGSSANVNINAAQEIDSLDSSIMSCTSYPTGMSTAYTAWLRKELDVDTVADLQLRNARICECMVMDLLECGRSVLQL